MPDLSYSSPPSGFPEPSNALAIVMHDDNGTLYVDHRGFFWRGPEYRSKYDALAVADPAFTGGWQKIGNWFRSRKVSPEYAPTAIEKELEYVKPVAVAGAGLGGVALLAVAVYAGVQIMNARGWKF